MAYLSKITGLLRSDFIKNVAILSSGTIVAQGISLLAAPISSRIFSPDQYGALGIYMAISGLLGTMAFSHFPQAIMIAKDDDEAKNLVWFSIVFASLIVALTLPFTLLVWWRTDWLNGIGYWTLSIPLTLMLNAITTSLQFWANRCKQYKIITKNRIAQVVLTVVIQLAVGYFISTEYGLMAGLLTGQISSVILLIRPFLLRRELSIGRPVPSAFKSYFNQYKAFLLYTTPSDFINNLLNQLPVYFLNAMAGLSFVGNYAFAHRLLGLPASVVGSSIADVFRQKAGEVYRANGECKGLFQRTAKTLAWIGIGPLVVLICYAPEIFSYCFGPEWRNAGEMARILSPLYFLRIIVSPLSYLYILAGRMREDLLIHLVSIILISITFLATNHIFHDKSLLIAGYTAAYITVYIFYYVRSYQFSRGN